MEDRLIKKRSSIAAISTPRGTGGVAIVRLSGPESWHIARSLSEYGGKNWEPGRVYHDWLIDPLDGRALDEVLFLIFKAPHSFTGEDCVEIHCHGGIYLSKSILRLCLNQGAEPAPAGEFTRRAFLNGRIDLTQAESILDLISAQGEAMVKLSANNLHHRVVGSLAENYLKEISRIQADLAASIDFPEEVEEPDRHLLANSLYQLANQLEDQIERSHKSQIIREGIEVAIIGMPNVGKSSLFNALLESERSIVTEIAGTTRDVIRETVSLKGIPLTLVDTAGLRETTDRVEILGVERSWQALESSQAVIYVLDGTVGMIAEDCQLLDKIRVNNGILVFNKQDKTVHGTQSTVHCGKGWPSLKTSAVSGEGINSLLSWLETIAETVPGISEIDCILSHRQIQHLSAVKNGITDAANTLESPAIPLDLATVGLTEALLELQSFLGKDTSEMVLDSVFERFCVGK